MASENESEKRETLADIAAEIRRDIKLGNNYYAANLPDRIEAAWKREKAEWESAACACVSDAVMSGRIAVEHEPVGNAAAMRDALDAALRFIGNIEIEPYSPLDEAASELRQRIMDALAAPARQCDVGTPDEKYQRWVHFCEQRLHSCHNCECKSPVGCTFKFGDMPYAAEEGGAS